MISSKISIDEYQQKVEMNVRSCRMCVCICFGFENNGETCITTKMDRHNQECWVENGEKQKKLSLCFNCIQAKSNRMWEHMCSHEVEKNKTKIRK